MENKSKKQVESVNNSNEKLLLSDVIKSLPCDYMVTMHDSEEEHFCLNNELADAKDTYKYWSKGKSVMDENARIYLVIDITEEVKGNVL